MQFILGRKFKRKYVKLSKKVQKKFKERKNLFLENSTHPILNIHKLSGEFEGKWSMNVTGDYRVIFDKSQTDIIIFINIGTHSELFG